MSGHERPMKTGRAHYLSMEDSDFDDWSIHFSCSGVNSRESADSFTDGLGSMAGWDTQVRLRKMALELSLTGSLH